MNTLGLYGTVETASVQSPLTQSIVVQRTSGHLTLRIVPRITGTPIAYTQPHMHSLDKDKHVAESIKHETVSRLLADAVDSLGKIVHALAVSNGFWESSPNDGEKLMLIVSELGEALEALRAGNPPSEHIPEYTAVEEEMADVVIRVMDLCAGRGWRLGEAILAKHAMNTTRPRKHGKAF